MSSFFGMVGDVSPEQYPNEHIRPYFGGVSRNIQQAPCVRESLRWPDLSNWIPPRVTHCQSALDSVPGHIVSKALIKVFIYI